MLNKIWQFLKRLFHRLFGIPPQTSPPPNTSIRPTLSDAEYESKFMEILAGVSAGWSRGDVAGFLIAKRLKDSELASWLRRFGARLLEVEAENKQQEGDGDADPADAVASLQELAQRLVLLSRIRTGELGDVAREIGEEILTRFPLPEVEDDGGKGTVIEAVFIGDGLGVSAAGNRSDVGGEDSGSELDRTQ